MNEDETKNRWQVGQTLDLVEFVVFVVVLAAISQTNLNAKNAVRIRNLIYETGQILFLLLLPNQFLMLFDDKLLIFSFYIFNQLVMEWQNQIL